MTVTTSSFEILGSEFDLDELADIANHGCAAGVSGFIYSSELHDVYEENESTIWDFLDEQADSMGEQSGLRMVINVLENKGEEQWTMQQVKELAVWMYVELQAYNLCCENEHPDFA